MSHRLALALPATLLAAAAFAQQAPDVPQAPLELPQISVEGAGERADGPVRGYNATRSATATRTDTPLRDIPQAINVVPRDLIEDQRAVSLDDVVRNVPGIQPAGTSGNRGEGYFVRGFQVQGYAIDGVRLNPAMGFPDGFRDLANVERVEVLKGPASVLYGIGDPGGLINIVTRRPQFTPAGSINLDAGSYGYQRGEFDITGGDEGSGLAARLTGAVMRDDGFRQIMRRSDRTFLAPSMMWQPNDRTRVVIGMSYLDQTTPFDRGLVAQGRSVSMPTYRYFGEAWSRNHTDATDLNWRIEHEATDWLTVRQVAHFDWMLAHRFSADPVALAADGRTLTRRATDQDDNSQSADLLLDATARFRTGIVQHSITAGVEYLHGKRSLQLFQGNLASIDILNPQYGALPGRLALRTVRNDVIDMTSGFMQYQLDIGSRLILLGGFRYDNFHQREISNGVDTASSGDAFSPRFGALYRVRDNVALFASWSRSFIPQLGGSFDGTAFNPETGQQYEAGVRVDLIPDRLSVTLAAFNIRRQNVLVSDPVNAGFSIQTGEQRSRGVELDIAGEILPGWRIYAGAAYTDAVITEDSSIRSGTRLPGVPLWSGNVWTTYEIQDGKARGLTLGGGVFLVAARNGDLNNSFRVGGYGRMDLTASYPITEHVRAAVSIRNVTDARYIAAPVSRAENYPGGPRTVLASLRFSF
ncbi:MAG TPA: TonB-dependent siderophore receptor [Roseomonas sp.]